MRPHELLLGYLNMAAVSGSVKTIGRLGSLSLAVGLILFLGGLFVLPRMFTFAGIALLVLALILYWLEESGVRKAEAANSR